ncbi:hypothetical protein BGZ60DRAFT_532947 [Tricladium varicosporioides]|nr:hypothetical protein BGZ60DRAFT_532947 [Hymenoscyphus varicosporioides]
MSNYYDDEDIPVVRHRGDGGPQPDDYRSARPSRETIIIPPDPDAQQRPPPIYPARPNRGTSVQFQKERVVEAVDSDNPFASRYERRGTGYGSDYLGYEDGVNHIERERSRGRRSPEVGSGETSPWQRGRIPTPNTFTARRYGNLDEDIGYFRSERSFFPPSERVRSRDHSRHNQHQAYLDRENTYHLGVSPDGFYSEKGAYSFTLSRHLKTSLSRDSTLDSGSDTSEHETSTTIDSSSKPPIPHQGKILRVLQSQYTGDGSIGGIQSAKLSILEDHNDCNQKASEHIFRWVQFEESTMNLDKFEAGCRSIPSLTDSQRHGISRIFTQLRRKYDKPMQTPNGAKARFMVPGVVQEPLLRNSDDKTSRAETVTWTCLPYFSLQKYTDIPTGLHAASHPVRTLLQARFSLTREERDMQQAVCQLGGTPRYHCFHIAQLWCILVDDNLVITCTSKPALSLTEGSISFEVPPKPREKAKHHTGHIIVRDRNLLWSFPREKCESWFAFVSNFWEYWPKEIQFSYNGKAITPLTWPRIFSHSYKTTIRINLEIKSSTVEPKRGIILFPDTSQRPGGGVESLNTPSSRQTDNLADEKASKGSRSEPDVISKGGQDTTGNGKDPTHSELHTQTSTMKNDIRSPRLSWMMGSTKYEFHVFTFLNENQPKSWPVDIASENLKPDSKISTPRFENILSFDEDSLKGDLAEIDHFLEHESGFRDHLIYKKCPQRTQAELYHLVQNTLAALDNDEREKYRMHEDTVEMLNRAEIVFRFFLPSWYEGPTTGKFWGALYFFLISNFAGNSGEILTYRRPEPSAREALVALSQMLGELGRWTQNFRDVCSHADYDERSSMELSENFPKAWLSILMSVVTYCINGNLSVFHHQGKIARELLLTGLRSTVQDLTHTSLSEYAILKPWELTSLVNYQLLGDITSSSLDTSDTYFEYLNNLESAIETKPLDRGHQDRISCFKQEISVILETLEQQRSIIQVAQPSLTFHETRQEFKIRPTNLVSQYRTKPHINLDDEHGSHYSRADATAGSSNIGPYGRTPLYRASERYQTNSAKIHSRVPETFAGTFQTYNSQLDPLDQSGIQTLLQQDSQALIDSKIRDFREMSIRASELEAWNLQKIDYNKDRQEAAIYAFTIVTIIFLPLSTVASILGMNVNDIRNMELNQWVFWATALPLAAIIIVLCLIWAGELENFWRGFSNIWRRNHDLRQFATQGPPPQSFLSTRPPPPMPVTINNRIYDEDYYNGAEIAYRPPYRRRPTVGDAYGY